jgi:Organic solute transporter Ostalpha
MMHGRPPKNHAWPLNYVFSKVDISDPHTFLAIKRGILQYAWLKPILSIMTIILKLAGVYQESQISVNSGYLWIAILYNLSVTVSLYSLAMFWVCMSQDLKPFRPVPKFLCIKLIIFASYWQGFFLSILQVLGAIPSGVEGYGSADNLAAAIQDALICIEMPIFAVAHWYAFSWHDYADVTISAARMPVKHALRDAFGIRDLVQDSKETFGGKKYEYRAFDSGDNVLAHEESGSRRARLHEGMRYSRGGKGKYWIPKPGEGASARTPLLRGSTSSGSDPSPSHGTIANDELDGGGIDDDMEKLYAKARALEFGDWNYPVITAHVASRDRWQHASPHLLTTSTNRNILHPTKLGKDRRENQIEERFNKGKGRGSSAGTDESGGKKSAHRVRAPVVEQLIREDSSTSSRSVKSGRSQLVDVVVEDEEAEEAERARARKEGGPKWNKDEPEHFV